MTSTLPAAAAEASPGFGARRRWAVLGVVLAADVLDLVDGTVTNVAAPTIARDLGGGAGLVQWLGDSYALALGVLLVLGGRLGDKFGRRRLFLAGLGGFTVASVACGIAPNPELLVSARLLQGACGALVIPQGFGILGATWPREQIGKAFSLFGPVMGLSAVGGPVLAGFLIDADLGGLGWRSMFLINLVLGGAAFLAAVRLLPRDRGDRRTVVDALGSVLLGCAMLGLLAGFIEGAGEGWTTVPFVLLAAGAVCFAAFCLRQRVASSPLIRPSLLHNRGFTSGLLLGVVFFAAVSGLLYVVSLFLQQGLGRSPTGAAVALLPLSAGIVVASVACYRLIGRYGRTLVLAGLALTVAGIVALLAIVANSGTDTGGWALAPALLVVGLGMGTCFGSTYDVTIGDIAPDEAGSASGALGAVQQLSNAVGAALVTTVYFHTADGHGTAHAAVVSLAVVGCVALACCGVVPLLPRKAQESHGR
ncbi:MFS transporter [Streptomyces kunmingensis]|uniref:MFS transporter n=1 Tax=Streptomyces kunmingensis TaxID=68225 RepID=A0ABU6CPM4_9ACTN|nr:MFS transporter [Streptomyces kunmingensis]MEB3966688.1 MFS transporter [Streptomyces kunmingensis]